VDNISERTIRLPDTDIAAILTTCRKIYIEAAPTFYEFNVIHHSISTWGAKAIHTRPFHLSFLKSLSLDYSNPFPDLSGSDLEMPDTDRAIGYFLEMINKQCIKLEALTLHILIRRKMYDLTSEFSKFATAKALAALAPRLKHLVIISPTSQDLMLGLCETIAPWDQWVKVRQCQLLEFHSWPFITIPPYYLASMQTEFDSSNGTGIWMRPIDGDSMGIQTAYLQAT